MIRKMFPILLVLALGLAACDFHISLPITQKIGPTVVDDITVPVPADASATTNLSFGFGAGTLKLHPGTDSLVSGTATYNISDFKPTVTTDGSNVRVEQGDWRLSGIPDVSNIKNEWDIALGGMPVNLTVEGGAYHAEYQFGGLALTNLTIKDGAADVKLDFDTANTTEMLLFQYETGASNVSMTGLGNANFTSMQVNSGAGNYSFDFSGDLKRNGSVNIKTGFSNLTLVIPEGVKTQITVIGGLSNVSIGSGWLKNGNVYTQEGSGSQLIVVVEIGAGNLTITR